MGRLRKAQPGLDGTAGQGHKELSDGSARDTEDACIHEWE